MTAIADAAHMTRQNWYRYEKGEARYIPIDTLREIERAIDWSSGVEIKVDL